MRGKTRSLTYVSGTREDAASLVTDQFAHRVTLYAALDERLHTATRFFGAAALTNAALVELCSLPCPRRWACRLAIDYFGVIGTALEVLNLKLSQRIERGGTPQDELDKSLVMLEQLEVEQLLRQHACHRFHYRAIAQINHLLHWAHQLAWPLRHCPSIRIYGQVLGRMRARLGRPANFLVLGDRIGIGHTLTTLIRGLGPGGDSVDSYSGYLRPRVFRGLVRR